MSNQNQNQVALPAIQHADKKSLMVLLGSLFEKIDDLASNDKINTGEYVDLMNLVKDMAEIQQEVKTHIIYRTIDRQARRKEPKLKSTELEKMTDPYERFTTCKFCDKTIAKSYILTHQTESITCARVRQTKQSVVVSKKKYSPFLYARCQSYNTELLPRYQPIKKLTMSLKVLKALEIEKPVEVLASIYDEDVGIYEKVDDKWVYIMNIPFNSSF